MKTPLKAIIRNSPPASRSFELSGLNSGVPTPLALRGAASQSNQLPPVAGLNSGVPTPLAPGGAASQSNQLPPVAGLNSGVPTPLAPGGAASQYEARGSARIARAKHCPQGGHSWERGQQSNQALTRSLPLGSPSSGCAPAQSIQAVPTALYCLTVSRRPRLSGCLAALAPASAFQASFGRLSRAFPRSGIAGYNAAPAARCSPVAGFSLVEVVIAIGIAAFCLVTMLGLIPSGLKAVNATTEQTAATAIISEVMTDLRDTPLGSNTSPVLAIQLTTNGSTNDSIDGAGTNTTNFYVSESCTLYPTNTSLDARYGVTLSLSNSSLFITTARVQVWWPPTVPPAHAVGSVEAISAIMRH